MKTLLIALSMVSFSSATLACPGHEETTATQEQKAPPVAKKAKKAPRSESVKKTPRKT
jgi:hypothetical protein